VLGISWDAPDAQAIALDAARRLREHGIACACNLTAGGDGVLRVTARDAQWSSRGHDEHGSVDAAVLALSRRDP
jgi:hypothetical protein